MKQIFVTVLAAAALSGTALAQRHNDDNQETIKGNGVSVTRDVSVSSFNAIKAAGVYELELAQGDKPSVRIQADENLQQYFDVHNEGDELVIKMKDTEHKNFSNEHKMKVYVTFTSLKSMDLKMVGNLSSTEQLSFDELKLDNKSVGNVDLKLKANKLNLNNSSVGNIRLSGNAQDAVVKNSGVGNLDAGDLVVQHMNLDNTGIGNAEVNAAQKLDLLEASMGKVSNRGSGEVHRKKRTRV